MARATRSHETRRVYIGRVGEFLEWAEAAGRLGDLDSADDLAWAARDWADTRRWMPATTNTALAAVRAFSVALGHDPAPVRTERIARQAPKALSTDEEIRVTAAATAIGTRAGALVAIMLGCGLRVGEVTALDVGDVDIGHGTGSVTVRRGKGGHWRRVPVPPKAAGDVSAWLAERGPGPGPLITGRGGRRLSTRRVEQLVAEVGERAGVRLFPHALRHTFATRMLRAGADPVLVAEALGHASLNQTLAYTRGTFDDLARAVALGEARPRAHRAVGTARSDGGRQRAM
jgi:integrase